MFDAAGSQTMADEINDQSRAMARIMEAIRAAGLMGDRRGKTGRGEIAVLGKAGTGKTHLLVQVAEALGEMSFTDVTLESEGPEKAPDGRTFAIASPTNKAASVLRRRGVNASTIHRLLYVPVYSEDFQGLTEWLRNPEGPCPGLYEHDDETVAEIVTVYRDTGSMPAALGAVGLRGSDFIVDWTVRENSIDVGLIDEASMITEDMMRDLKRLFKVLVFFGDPAQLAPVGCNTMPIIDGGPAEKVSLTEIRRQSAGNPILDVAHMIQDSGTTLEEVEAEMRRIAASDDRIVVSPRACADTMRNSPLLVWRNATRLRVIKAWRAVHGLDPQRLGAGEPVVINGVEIRGAEEKKGRVALERAGLVKGATAIYVGPGRKHNFARLMVSEGEEIYSVGAIIEFEQDGKGRREIAGAAKSGLIIAPCAALTVHKSQGSQYPTVQVYAPDIAAAAASGREESGAPLWKRLAYVAVTRAQNRLVWVTSPKMTRPQNPLGRSASVTMEAA